MAWWAVGTAHACIQEMGVCGYAAYARLGQVRIPVLVVDILLKVLGPVSIHRL